MRRGLFLNSTPAQCSIYESGKMIYNALNNSGRYRIDYQEIDRKHRRIPSDYDFLAFNYHPFTMDWLDTTRLRELTGLAITFVLEVLPNNPFPMCPANDFDVYCAIDPTMRYPDERVYAFPRPLEPCISPCLHDSPIPVIGTFGFATHGKGFEKVVEAVNDEFESSIIRMNIPIGTTSTSRMIADEIIRNCTRLANPGISVQITHDYMSKPDLIRWCSENTLNVFLYDRSQPGLAATTDQAISSGRPLAVSGNPTFRHIHQYVMPYPWRSLKDSICMSGKEVLRMQNDWTPAKFAKLFEDAIMSCRMNPLFGTGQIVLPAKNPIEYFKSLAMNRINPVTTVPVSCEKFSDNVVLVISQNKKKCGIYQYGKNITNSLKKSKKYTFIFCECGNRKDLQANVDFFNPTVMLYNYHQYNMPWLTSKITRSFNGIPQLSISHEFKQETADNTDNTIFDYTLYQDPTLVTDNPYAVVTKQLIPPYTNHTPLPAIPTIGSFGFGFADKGFEKIVRTVQDEFSTAIINLHMPFNDVVDRNGSNAKRTAQNCRNLLNKPNIVLNITHNFLTEKQLLDFLAGNTINCFFTDPAKQLGISSTIQHALAVQRPIAITRCPMFRHIWNAEPSICIEDSSLKDIIMNGTKPLQKFYEEWNEEAFVKDYERILDKVLS